MAKCPYDSCTQVDATTLDWFCIAQHNYDAELGKWPTEILTELQGRQWTFTLPTDLPSGKKYCLCLLTPMLTCLHRGLPHSA